MNLIEQANSQKHVWKTLDILRDIITKVETSQYEQQNINMTSSEDESKSLKSAMELMANDNKTQVLDMNAQINSLETMDRDENRKKLLTALNDVRSCNEILQRSLRRSKFSVDDQS